jgi:hypothetical protein
VWSSSPLRAKTALTAAFAIMPRAHFSIVIPTADRHELLDKTIAACLLSPYPNLEVLVSDNFSTPETAKVVEGFRADPRVRYVRTERRLSMPDHWEFAWRQSDGDFIIINGDDDGLSPGLIDQLNIIADTFQAALMSWDAGLYYHPDWDLSGVNTFTFMTGHSQMLIDVDPQAVFASYARLSIPICFPQGTRICFSRALADRAVTRVGRVFWPPFSDYSAPLLLLGLLKDERYIYLDALLGYGGRSSRSNAASMEKEGNRTGNQERICQFYGEFHRQDIYPHQELKMRSLWNGHAETLNLLRHILPEAFDRHHVDQVALITAIECEFRGIDTHNPFLGPRERIAFEAFLARQDPEVVGAAMQQVGKRAALSGLERWTSNPTSVRGPLMHLARQIREAMKIIARGRLERHGFERVAGELKRLTTGGNGTTGKTNSTVRCQYMGRMIKVQCADVGCHNGLDLACKLDGIAQQFDHRGWSSVEAFGNAGLMRAAYTCTNAISPAQVLEPIKP